LFIGPLIQILNQPEYAGVGAIVPWIAGFQVISALYFYYGNGIVLAKRTDLLIVPALVQLLTLALGSAALVGTFQLGGIIASKYLSVAVFFGLSVYLSQRVFPMPQRWGVPVAYGVSAAILAAASLSLPTLGLAADIILRLALMTGYVAGALYVATGREGRRGVPEPVRLPAANEQRDVTPDVDLAGTRFDL
jgi:hypothetical protein